MAGICWIISAIVIGASHLTAPTTTILWFIWWLAGGVLFQLDKLD